MQGYLAVTDLGWYRRLSRDPGPKDANFWRPSARVSRFPVGTPFLFKLKAPAHAIAGYGFFASFSILPDWLAWDTFGEANGVESLAALRERLETIQKRGHIQADPTGRIGCCLIAEAVFFQEGEWIAPPASWKPRTQTGSRLDLTAGEGARIWQECLARTSGLAAVAQVHEEAPRFGSPVLRVPRLGQGIFRVQVLDAYGRACAVTSEHSLPVLEAAHIMPYAVGGEHDLANGLALRSDLHRLFDRGYITVDEGHRLVVGKRLKEDFDNGRSYYGLRGAPLNPPAPGFTPPSAAMLEYHREHVFLG